MESMQKLAKELEKMHTGLPHLPKGGQKWLAQNAWWLVLIGVILGALAVLMTISGMTIVGGSLALFAGPVGAAVGGWLVLLTILSLAIGIVVLVISALAISPLKHQKDKGWELLLLSLTINVVTGVAFSILSLNIATLLWTIVFSALGAYFILEMREQYGKRGDSKKGSAAK